MLRRSALPLVALPWFLLLPSEAIGSEDILDTLKKEAHVLRPFVHSELGRRFLEATGSLPAAEARTVFLDREEKAFLSPAAAARLGEEKRATVEEQKLSAARFYTTKYGTPLAYCRPVDLLGQHGLKEPAGMRFIDFGYGTIGHLRLLASLGVDVAGIDVDSFLEALYSQPGDQGVFPNESGPDGRVTLFRGHWPGNEDLRRSVGEGYDVFLSKNTLKRGYLHPERPVDSRRLVHLGVDDTRFLSQVHRTLKPGGWFLIYNLCPAQNPPDEPYLPHADGRCPFPREAVTAAGFEVVEFDRVDDPAIRKMARLLGWDQQGMEIETGLFAWYSLFRRPERTTPKQDDG